VDHLDANLAALIFDVRTLDLGGFRRWLDMQLARWATKPVFAQRRRIRDLRRAHPELLVLEEEHRRALSADEHSPNGPRLREIERLLSNTDRAVQGLTDTRKRAAAERRPALQAKINAFVKQRRRLKKERTALTEASPERANLMLVANALESLRRVLNLDREESELMFLQTAHGHGSNWAGRQLEEKLANLTRSTILPQLNVDPDGVQLLHSVRLGAAGVEIDQIVCRQTDKDEPVEVLAIVEAKRNINDLGHGFARRQIDLAWLTGDRSSYDPEVHRTGVFDTGHFDRPKEHWQDGRAFVFTAESFRHFVRGAEGYFIERFFVVTMIGNVWGLASSALAQVEARVAGNERWNPDDLEYCARLLVWTKSLARPLEAPDVLRLYTADATRAGQLLLVAREPEAANNRPVFANPA
jgi:hypothetical protein